MFTMACFLWFPYDCVSFMHNSCWGLKVMRSNEATSYTMAMMRLWGQATKHKKTSGSSKYRKTRPNSALT